MSHVFIVHFEVGYDGSEIKGVFSTREKAVNHIEKNKSKVENYNDSSWERTSPTTWKMDDYEFSISVHEIDYK